MKVTTIFGPPGTGKTARLVDFAKDEDGGLFLSYTKAAATEAVSRMPGHAIRPSTLHSLAFNGLGMNRASVVDKDKLKLFSKATGIPFKGSEYGSDEEQEGDQYLQVLSFARNRLMLNLDEAYDHFGQPGTRQNWKLFYAEYESWKQTFGYMDFDDMLTLYTKDGKPRHRIVFGDEMQDCTPLQWQVFNRAIESAERVFIAGDDDQAIYEWNGANPHGMIEFNNKHDGDIIVLEQSHRLPRLVFNKAVSILGQITKRQKKVWTHRKADGTVVQWRDLEYIIDHLDRLAPGGALLLMRDRFKMEEMKQALNREYIPYDVYGGISPWTSRIATALRKGDIDANNEQIPLQWRDWYRNADLTQPIKYHLSTVHSAKGREHDTVIMDLDCPNRVLLNLSRDRDAEVRVQYVGLTRAKTNLILCGGNPIV